MAGSWQCLVCGHVMEGPNVLEMCPVCGADPSQIVPQTHRLRRLLRDVYDTFLPHAVAAHFPSGVLPAAQGFLALALLTGSRDLERTAFFLLILAVAVVPVSFATGLYDWKHRCRGLRVAVFYRKRKLAVALFVLGVAAVGLRATHPDPLAATGLAFGIYCALVFAMLPVVVLLGHYGGKLVFYWRKR
ncbi:MAG: hypothetical protein Kow0092_34960 [Deferrisomatales bacterium]